MKPEPKNCLVCNILFYRKDKESIPKFQSRKFCSRKCQRDNLHNKNIGNEWNRGRAPWNKGKEMSDDFKIKARNRQIGIKHSEERKLKIQRSVIKTAKEKESWHTPEGSKRIAESMTIRRITIPQKYKDTKPELATQRRLERSGIKFQKQVLLPGLPDFLLPESKTIIFVDGCSVHYCEYCIRRGCWTRATLETKAKDERNNQKLKEMGYRVIRVKVHSFKSK